MGEINPVSFRQLLDDAGIAVVGTPAKESLVYHPYGAKIRELMYAQAMDLLDQAGYQRVLLSDFVLPETLNEIDKVSKVSGGYMKIDGNDLMVAAGHEVNAYLYIRNLLKHHADWNPLPVKIYNFGPVYRTNKNTKFPFNLGERKSFMECYSVFASEAEAEKELDFAKEWNRKVVRELFHVPSVEVLRPISTNKKISKQTTCIDSITPFGETVITGMTYFHNDIFTRTLAVKYKNAQNKNCLTYSAHFGISEHIYFSYLLNACDGENIRLLQSIAPVHVSVLDCSPQGEYTDEIKKLCAYLQGEGIRTECRNLPAKKIPSALRRNTIQGIPVSLIFKKVGNEKKTYLVFQGQQQIIEVKTEVEWFGIIQNFLTMNDAKIILDMIRQEKDSIIFCDQIEKVDDIVQAGHIAKIYMDNTDDNVASVESRLFGGEVLGFQKAEGAGTDLVTGKGTNMVAYVSRRS